jgi:hypothetical protein
MEGAMKHAIVAGISVALAASCGAGDASAAVWRWGCMGPLGDQEIIFTLSRLVVLPAKPRAELRHFIFLDDLTEGSSDIKQYTGSDANDESKPRLEFTLGDDNKNKIALTEKSSKRTSHHAGVLACRDEIVDVFRKVYQYRRNDEPAKTLTLRCMDYTLSTRGGRPCVD